MRSTGFVATAIIAACIGCSGDSGSSNDGRGKSGSNQQRAVSGSGGVGTGVGGNFGNPNGPQMTLTPTAMGTGGATSGAAGSGPCQVGMFCAPTSPDPGDCGTLTLESTVKMVKNPGNLLLIWDRSTSMTEDWSGMPKWSAAGPAMIGALTPIADQLTIGAIFFPSQKPGADDNSACIIPGCSCSVDPYTSTEQIPFQPGATALQLLQGPAPSGINPMYGPVGMMASTDPNAVAQAGQTPTSEAVTAASTMLQNSTLMGTTAAAIVTDGEPNCRWDQTATVNTISTWLTMLNVKTYVIGLPGSNGGMGPTVLNALAQAGGTDQYIVPTDAMTLQQKLMDIVMSTVSSGFDSCSIDLMPAADPADKLQLVLTETVMGVPTDEAAPHDLMNGGGGWTISKDGKHVELVGSLCSDAMGGRFGALKFTYGCKELPPLPPNPPPE